MFGANCGQTKERSRLGCSKIDTTISPSKDRILDVSCIGVAYGRRAYVGIAYSRRVYVGIAYGRRVCIGAIDLRTYKEQSSSSIESVNYDLINTKYSTLVQSYKVANLERILTLGR